RAARSGQWVSATTVILTLTITLTTARFHDFATLSAQEWHGVIMAALTGACVWLLLCLKWAVSAPTLDPIVQALTRGARVAAWDQTTTVIVESGMRLGARRYLSEVARSQ